ncbi:MAG: leucine--tRNA ligase [Anaerolineaceae bacterium]|nr:leucine--tRNA ligase [Anaerolineaceae bacterium]
MAIESSNPVFNPQKLDKKWQKRWEADGLYHADIDPAKPKHYAMTMLPYPSGDLHIGHWYAMTPADAHARYMRMKGYNVMFPMGFDAFGLPAENAAIKSNIHPKEYTYKNIDHMREQMKTMGTMIDWRREMVSADLKYYHWTEWFFIQLFKHGLAYRKQSPVDWCPTCNTTLAREQVWGDDRHCERCNTPVIKKNLVQWFFRTTNYAEELLSYEGLDWPEQVKTLQTNWIGRSTGALVTFKTVVGSQEFEIFTTRPDTLWGTTFMVLAPEHKLVKEITTSGQKEAVEAYVEEASRQTEIQRQAVGKEKTGVFTGAYAVNPVNGEEIPIWIADYVLTTYGTGAIMGVPAHDQRDFEFARKFGLEVRVVIQPVDTDPIHSDEMTESVPAKGAMVNSGELTGISGEGAIQTVCEWLEKKAIGHAETQYKLRDWLISRQRYWGAPIPMIHCPKCGSVPVPEEDLPVVLPDDVEWKPTGESPLKLHPTWKYVKCPVCGGEAERDTDTMDTFMCSSWYHLRYLSPDYDKGPFDPAEYDYWMPVDTYTGGIEHANMHLIYTRFFHKACRDMGITKGDEPMIQLRNQGMVLGEDGEKMSKSRGNTVPPDELVEKYGADTVRAYIMFFCRWNLGGPWSYNGIEGTSRWLKRVWSMITQEPNNVNDASKKTIRGLRRKLHQTLKSVNRDYEEFEFNTIISSLMELANYMAQSKKDGAFGSEAWNEAVDIYLKMLAPIAPHIAEELWEFLGKPYSIHTQTWPVVDEEAAKEDEITLIVQINGKLRDRIMVPADISNEDAEKEAFASEAIQNYMDGAEPRKVIVIPGRLVNIVK